MSLQMGEPKREKKKNRTPDKTDRHEGLAEQRDIIKIQRILTYCKRKQKKKHTQNHRTRVLDKSSREDIPSSPPPEAPERNCSISMGLNRPGHMK